jgi:calmodulin
MIAEIREIFTLFDKDADGYVSTQDLGTIIRGLNMNPSQREVEEMVRDVDPSATGTFNQNALVSLIARRPKKDFTLEEIIEAIRICTNTGEQEGEGKDGKIVPNKMQVQDFITAMDSMGKSTGEDLANSQVMRIIKDCNLENDAGEIVIEDFAKYLLSR